jgi:hypothetical protein
MCECIGYAVHIEKTIAELLGRSEEVLPCLGNKRAISSVLSSQWIYCGVWDQRGYYKNGEVGVAT